MSQYDNPYAAFGGELAAQAPAVERAEFIKKTYIHLAAAIYAFVAFEFALFKFAPVDEIMARFRGNAWIVLIAFIGVSWLADYWARSSTSRAMQYAGLFLYVAAQALIFVPILWLAQQMELAQGSNIIGTAALITVVVFGGLTAAVFLTGADFSFLRMGLMLAGFAALGLVLCSAIFGFALGNLFTVAMIVFASAYILYDTSNIMHHYRTEQYVAASLALFASVALLFFYILRLVMSSRD